MKRSAAIEWLARALAIIGGLVLIAITILTVVSITGRAFARQGLGPIPGDFELVQVLTAFAVFAFLPWCQVSRGHASVDVFTSFLSDRANRIIDLVSELLMTGMIVLIAWRLCYGMLDKIRYHETTFILQFPVWWGYAASLVAAVLAVIVSFYMLAVRIHEVATGQSAFRATHGGMV
ncbi:TRAP-type C4-dicarboxylate transport system permease small subunit [Mesorhizobium sp. J18]|uniref:TRAP transporter small permease n=1 Tax=Mesorhizobium sp. J18 TaxID=935263 RepID=UPI00119BAA61|nr:TRAP transporter small permease [Mesorhizobium sp. J18]TWG93203.1 TRAP-type C4-dicarboxylate transport system permease small subunit [Mesorhizobium sp. J18]